VFASAPNACWKGRALSAYAAHTICRGCYADKEPGREPVCLNPEYADEAESCCFCGKLSSEGIYMRARRDEAPCCHCLPN
jgi:hypothetical protein